MQPSLEEDKKPPLEDPYTLILSKPRTIAGQLIAELILTEPTTGQVEKSSNESNITSQYVVLIADVAKVPQAVVRQLAYTDFIAATNYLRNFISAGGPATGENT